MDDIHSLCGKNILFVHPLDETVEMYDSDQDMLVMGLLEIQIFVWYEY